MKMRIISGAVCLGLFLSCQGFCSPAMDELGSAAASVDSLQLSPADQATLLKNEQILANPLPCRPFEELFAKLGFDRINVLISEQDVTYQTLGLNNTVPFETALEQALSSFVNDGSQLQSPYSLVLKAAYEEAGIQIESPVPPEVDEKIRKILKDYINEPSSEIRLLSISEIAHCDEDVRTNWIFHLRVPELSRCGFWAIVDRTGGKPVYNYPTSSDCGALHNPGHEIPGIKASTPTPVSQTLDAVSKDAWTPEEMRIADAIAAGSQLYNDYGNQLTLVHYDGWPGNIPKYGYFEEIYKNYVDNKEKIDHLRIDIRRLWRQLKKLERKKTPEAAQEAERILQEMEKKGAQYSEFVKQSNAYIREGLRLNAAGMATFPAVLHNVRLVKGHIRIPLYGDNGKKIQRKGRCLKWSKHVWDWPWTPVWRCDKWEMIDVLAKVPDYYLEYGYGNNPPRYEQVLPERLRMVAAEPVPAHPEDFVRKSMQRAQYDMEVVVTCTYSKPDKLWLISSARLRKGKAGSSDSLGGGVGVTAGGKVGVPLVAEGSMSVSVNVNYGHTWSHFRFGQMVEFREMYGKPCFELGKNKVPGRSF